MSPGIDSDRDRSPWRGSDRVRTQPSSWETNSIQAEVMWPSLRCSAQRGANWAQFSSARLCKICLTLCPSILVLHSTLGSAVCSFSLSALIRVTVGEPEIYLQPRWFICTAYPQSITARRESKCATGQQISSNKAATVRNMEEHGGTVLPLLFVCHILKGLTTPTMTKMLCCIQVI